MKKVKKKLIENRKWIGKKERNNKVMERKGKVNGENK